MGLVGNRHACSLLRECHSRECVDSCREQACLFPTGANIKIMQNNIPNHIAIIMDGNGRWAKERGLSRSKGHKMGVSSINRVTRMCADLGVEALTLYAFSTENWKRPKLEVRNLMNLLKKVMPKHINELNANNVKMRVIGRINKLSFFVRRAIKKTMNATQNNTGLVLNFALNYGGREEIVDGLISAIKNNADNLSQENFKQFFYEPDLQDVDLLIRTAGERRISNFMLWHIPNARMHFTEVLWPDFGEEDLLKAIM